jgi:hypothetical protein
MERYGVSFDWTAEGWHADADGWEHQRFTVWFVYTDTNGDERKLTSSWRQGIGIDHEPRPADVLSSLLLDVTSADQSFEDWASDFGYDDDSRKAEATYNACRTMRDSVNGWCSSQAMLDDFYSITEDES